MSLLMDALKRAEETKQDAARQMTGAGRPPAGGLTLEPVAQTQTVSLPDLAQHIDALDADLAAAAQPSAKAPPVARAAVEQPIADPNREAVRNAFAAKQPPANGRRPLWIALGTLGLAAVGIAAYVWFQLSQMGNHSLARPPGNEARPPLPPPVAALPAPQPPPPAAAVPGPPPAVFAPRPAAILTPDRGPAEFNPMASERPAPPQAIRLMKSRPEPDPHVARGYQNLQGSALEAAQRDYQQALKSDPKNVDALLGLAAIAQKQGRGGDADRYHQLALEADPKDASAQAAAIGSAAAADPLAAESRLKILLAAQPESGPLNFALGNLYSRQGRWSEAQSAYFNAVAAEGDNPDYLMNLAVSLDHLRQPRLAAQHYRLALEAAERRPAAFDRERLRKRLQELQP